MPDCSAYPRECPSKAAANRDRRAEKNKKDYRLAERGIKSDVNKRPLNNVEEYYKQTARLGDASDWNLRVLNSEPKDYKLTEIEDGFGANKRPLINVDKVLLLEDRALITLRTACLVTVDYCFLCHRIVFENKTKKLSCSLFHDACPSYEYHNE